MKQADQIGDIFEQAANSASDIISAVLQSLSTPPPTQDQMREAFQQVLAAPSSQSFEDTYNQWIARFGKDTWDRQVGLALRRARGGSPR